MSKRSKCCIIGIPDHQGVLNVGGRIGAGSGPSSFRKFFNRLQGRVPFDGRSHDLGDVSGLTADVALNHRLAAEFIHKGHFESGLSIIIGGGHDHGHSHLLGVSQALEALGKPFQLGCINIDAHLDVRKPNPKISSGSPFYLSLESRVLLPERFVEFGIQSHCNSLALWEYVAQKKVDVVPFHQLRGGRAPSIFTEKLRQLASHCSAVVVSLDLDSIASAFAPGVSAPQAEGFTSMEVIEMMEIAGATQEVVSLGIFELNPEHDLDNRTSRLAATAAYHFLETVLTRI